MDSDDGIASHLWTQVEGDSVSISDSTSAVMTFIVPKTDQNGKNLKFKLTVKDFGGLQVQPIVLFMSGKTNSPIIRLRLLSVLSPPKKWLYSAITAATEMAPLSHGSGILVTVRPARSKIPSIDTPSSGITQLPSLLPMIRG